MQHHTPTLHAVTENLAAHEIAAFRGQFPVAFLQDRRNATRRAQPGELTECRIEGKGRHSKTHVLHDVRGVAFLVGPTRPWLRGGQQPAAENQRLPGGIALSSYSHPVLDREAATVPRAHTGDAELLQCHGKRGRMASASVATSKCL